MHNYINSFYVFVKVEGVKTVATDPVLKFPLLKIDNIVSLVGVHCINKDSHYVVGVENNSHGTNLWLKKNADMFIHIP